MLFLGLYFRHVRHRKKAHSSILITVIIHSLWMVQLRLNCSAMKRRNQIGSLSYPNFARQAAEMDRQRVKYGGLPFKLISRNKQFLASCRNSYVLPTRLEDYISGDCKKSEVRHVNKYPPFAPAFTENGLRRDINLSAG